MTNSRNNLVGNSRTPSTLTKMKNQTRKNRTTSQHKISQTEQINQKMKMVRLRVIKRSKVTFDKRFYSRLMMLRKLSRKQPFSTREKTKIKILLKQKRSTRLT